MPPTKPPVAPTEAQEQAALVEFCDRVTPRLPALGLLFAIPNGEKRSKVTAASLKRQGVKPGVPDLFLPVPNLARGWHGLFLELKRPGGRGVRKGTTSDAQDRWITQLRHRGYAVAVCYGWREAATVLLHYLGYRPEEFGL